MSLASIMVAKPSHAQGGVGFRSGFTEGNGIPPRGAVELDYGSSVAQAGSTHSYTAGELVAHIPLSRRAGLRLHLNSYSWISSPQSQAAGREDMGFGTALIMSTNAGWRPDAALLTRVDVPSGSLPGQGNAWRPAAKAALAWRLPVGLTLASNLGLASQRANGNRFSQRFGSLWLGRSVTTRVGSFAEIFAFDRESNAGPSTRYVRGGVTLRASRDVHFDLHASTQLGAAAPRRSLGVGLKQRM
jgi:hypothetical protein